MLTVPPRLMPGAWSAFLTWIGTRTAHHRALAEAEEIHVDRLSFTGSSWKSRGMTRCLVPSTSTFRTV